MDVNTGGNLGRVADETTGEDKELIKSIKQDKARTKSAFIRIEKKAAAPYRRGRLSTSAGS